MAASTRKLSTFRCHFNLTVLAEPPGTLRDINSEASVDLKAADLSAAVCRALAAFVKAVAREPSPAVVTKAHLTRVVSLDGEPQMQRFLTDAELGKTRMCRSCGCTEKDCTQCVNRTGSPCSWIGRDLCSACDPFA